MTFFKDELVCIEFLELNFWENGPISPFDPNSKVYECKKRYKCKNTGKYFTIKNGTIFEGTKIPLKIWIWAIYILATTPKGISSFQFAKKSSLTQPMAWLLLHKIRKIMKGKLFTEKLSGIIEMDETFIGVLNKNRHKDKKVAQCQGRAHKDKTPVFGMIQRDGSVIAFRVPNAKSKSLKSKIYDNVEPESIVMTDEHVGYKGLGKHFDHKFVDHQKKQYANGDTTTKRIENFWSVVKRSQKGTYNWH